MRVDSISDFARILGERLREAAEATKPDSRDLQNEFEMTEIKGVLR
jgi:hypothetical protein